jgi:two-component system OmpR family response regulator
MAPILVIEDDRDARDMLCTWLEQHGYDTIAASDGHDALGKMEHAPELSLILLDLMMPGMTGWQFRTSQRSHRRFRKVPVVVMTAHPNPVGEAEWLDPEDVLLKPLDLQAVLKIVSRCCGPHDGSLGLPSGSRPS